MAKKDFKKSPAMSFITTPTEIEEEQEDIKINEEAATPARKAKEHTEKKRKSTNKLVGFYDDNWNYVQTLAFVKKMSATAYVNNLIYEDKEKNRDIYERFKEISM